MKTSYQERIHWIEAIVSFLAITYYFVKIAGIEGGLNGDLEVTIYLVVKTTIASVILTVILVSVNAGRASEADTVKDERDFQIQLRGYRNGYYVCSVMLTVILVGALVNEWILREGMDGRAIATINYFVHGLFLAGWLASVVQSTTHLFYYRRGIV